LDADEAAALEIHLRNCDSCRAELASYRKVSQGLMAALPPQKPPAEVRKQLQQSLPGRRRVAERTRASWSFGQIAIGLIALLLLGMNVFSFLQLRSLQQEQAKLLQQVQTDQAALSMLAYPETISLPIQSQQVAGSLLVNREQNTAMLVVWGLPPLPDNESYQAWLVQPDGIRVSAAVFRPEQGQSYTARMISVPQSLNTFSSLGVTIEPVGGSPQPTGQRVLKVDF
jgi:anti-sigma-K factor RskA